MSMSRTASIGAALCLAAWATPWQPAQAAPLTFSAGGVFSNAVASSFFTAPGAAWSVSFVVDSNPVPLALPSAVDPGFFTTVPFSDFTYTLNGVPIAEAALFVSLYNAGNSGGVDVFFNDVFGAPNDPVNALQFFGPQVYAGDEFTPTVLPGQYQTFLAGGVGFVAVVDGVSHAQRDQGFSIVPAPATALLVLPVLVLALRRRQAPTHAAD